MTQKFTQKESTVLYQSMMSRHKEKMGESQLIIYDTSKQRNDINMNSLEFIYFLVGKQPFKLGTGFNTDFGYLSYKPINLERDHHAVISKSNPISSSLRESLIAEILDIFDDTDFDKIINFLERFAMNLTRTEANGDILDEIFALNPNSAEDEEFVHEKALKIVFSNFVHGICLITRTLEIDEHVNAKKSELCHPSIQDMFNDLELLQPFNVKVKYSILLDDRFYIIPKEDNLKMIYPEIDCDYVELIGSGDYVECVEEKFVEDLEEKNNLSFIKYSIMHSVEDDSYRLKARIIGKAMDVTVKELNSVFNSLNFNQWLEANDLTDWNGKEEQDKLKDIRVLKDVVKMKNLQINDLTKEKDQQIANLKRELFEKGLDDFE